MKKTLLLVEDNRDLAYNLKLMLEDHGYQIITSENGEEALKILSESKILPDLIISDIMMPEMNGYDFFEAISSNIRTAHIPFIFLTALSSPENIRFGKLLGIDDYITKPIVEKDLLSIIEGKLSRITRTKLIYKNFNEVVSKHNITLTPSLTDKDISRTCLFLVHWDDKLGPVLDKSFPPENQCPVPINTVSTQLFHSVTLIYGQKSITKSEALLLHLNTIDQWVYLYFDSYPFKQQRHKKKLYLIGITAPRINYFDSIKIKPILAEISEKIKRKDEWMIQKYWDKIVKLLTSESFQFVA